MNNHIIKFPTLIDIDESKTKTAVRSLCSANNYHTNETLCLRVAPSFCCLLKALLLENCSRNWGKASLSGWFICFQLAPIMRRSIFRWAKDSAIAARSPEQRPCYCHGKRRIWPSCSMNPPANPPTCVKLPSLSSLMRPSQESMCSMGSNVPLRGSARPFNRPPSAPQTHSRATHLNPTSDPLFLAAFMQCSWFYGE